MTPSTLLTELAACLCVQIQDAPGPDVCFCGVIPGDAAVAEYAGSCNNKCGMAWVRLGTIYPSTVVGVIEEAAGNCGSGIGVDIEVGILRCAAMPDDRGNPPKPSALAASAKQCADDAMTMWRAISCCEAFGSKDFILRGYSPAGPMGGLVGGTWALSVGI